MAERKWFRDRPIRRTKSGNGMVKIIFDDGPKGQPGDTVTVPEQEYADGVKRVFTSPDGGDSAQRASGEIASSPAAVTS